MCTDKVTRACARTAARRSSHLAFRPHLAVAEHFPDGDSKSPDVTGLHETWQAGHNQVSSHRKGRPRPHAPMHRPRIAPPRTHLREELRIAAVRLHRQPAEIELEAVLKNVSCDVVVVARETNVKRGNKRTKMPACVSDARGKPSRRVMAAPPRNGWLTADSWKSWTAGYGCRHPADSFWRRRTCAQPPAREGIAVPRPAACPCSQSRSARPRQDAV